MEAFLYHQQQPSFILDPASYHQLQAAVEMSNASSCFTTYTSSDACIQAADSTSPNPHLSLDKKRKHGDGSCLSTDQSKGVKESKSRRKKPSGAPIKKKVEEKKDTKSTSEDPPSGYIHVRARRGQATDSHSLAERVRRERISERMKKLQGLVPGCDKAIGKALVLDEIINYVQSLQNQVEFLSMKLASVSHIFYDFGGGFEEHISQAVEMGSISQSIPTAIQNSLVQPTAFDAATNSSLQQVMGPAAPHPLHGQVPHNFNQGQWQLSTASGAQQHVQFPAEEKEGSLTYLLSCDQ